MVISYCRSNLKKNNGKPLRTEGYRQPNAVTYGGGKYAGSLNCMPGGEESGVIKESIGGPGGRSRIDQNPPGTCIFSEINKENIGRTKLVSERDKTHFLAQGYGVGFSVSLEFDSQYVLSTMAPSPGRVLISTLVLFTARATTKVA